MLYELYEAFEDTERNMNNITSACEPLRIPSLTMTKPSTVVMSAI